jgi:DNA-binding GntR family transcriptional regulator
VVESEIARQIGVSQAPVREAVKRLVNAGLLDSIPRNGSYVREISPDERRVSLEVRAQLETISARLATATVEDDDLAGLRGIVQQMRTATDADDWAAFRTLDIEFHRTVVGLAGAPVLQRIWDTLEPTLISQRAIGDPGYPGRRAALADWHTELVDALAAGDPETAAEAFRMHAAADRPRED